jgi:hypothetical protein
LHENGFDITAEGFDLYTDGQDFSLNITFVKIGWLGDIICVIGDYSAFNMTTRDLLTCPD